MNSKELDQLRSYAMLIVAELHKTVFDEAVFDKLKPVLGLAEELECYIANTNRSETIKKSNVVPFRTHYFGCDHNGIPYC